MKKLIKHILFFISAIVVCSCSPQTEELFDKSAVTRMNELLAKYADILTSVPNGWEMAYFPETNQIYGGVTFLLKFDQDKTHVTVATIKYPTAASPTNYQEATSTYHLSSMQGPVLTFDTYNDIITPYADADISDGGGLGRGYEGDIDFVIIDASSTRIELKGVKTGNRMIMSAVPANSVWSDRLNSIANVKADIAEALYTNYTLTVDGYTVDMVGASVPVMSYVRPGVNDPENTTDIAYAYTSTGISFYKPLEGFDKTIQHFDWDPVAQALICTDPGVTAILTPSHVADFVHYNDYLGSWKMSYVNYNGTTVTANNLTMREVPPGNGAEKFQYMELGPFTGSTGFNPAIQYYIQIEYDKINGLAIVPHYISGATHTSGARLIVYPIGGNYLKTLLSSVTTDAGLPTMKVEFGDDNAESLTLLYINGGAPTLVSSSSYWWKYPTLTRP